jgi:hypothetical protein
MLERPATGPAPATVPAIKPASPDVVLSRLTAFGWSGGLAAIIAGLVLSFFLFGYFAIYWRNADMDFMVVYNALVLNEGLPKEFFDHPSFFTILSVKFAFQVLHGLGLLDAYRLAAIPSAADPAAFGAAMTDAVRAGRLVALVTACAAVLVFAWLARRALRDWRIALLATFAFAFSGGVAVHLRILRSEMIAASFVVFALLIVIAAARRPGLWRPLALGAAAMLCVMALENKVHAIFLVAALPPLGLLFGQADASSVAFWRKSPLAWPAVALVGIAAALLCWWAAPIVAAGYDPAAIAAAGLKPLLFGRFGVYQCALAVEVVLAVVTYALVWRIAPAEAAATLTALLAGAVLGLLALDLQFNVNDAVAVLNPIEKMLAFAPIGEDNVKSLGGIAAEFNALFVWVLRRYSFILYPSSRPTLVVLWLVVPGILYALVRGKLQLALQATLLVAIAAGIDTLGVTRGLKSEYFVLSDPFIIIAGALLLDDMPQVLAPRWTLALGMLLMVIHVVAAHPEPVKMMTKRSGPEYICEWNQIYQPLLPMPWCALPPVKP